jgi:NitT/TauT family transport system ATP-binding protein
MPNAHVPPPRSAAAQGAPPVLSADDVSKIYPNGTRALAGTRLAVSRGEFVSLLGPSGCGKSTLLRMFAGLETPSAGAVRWHGGDPSGSAPGTHKLAMVFQEATLMPWATVERNVALPLELERVRRDLVRPRVARALAQVGLSDFARAYPRELSGGMQMRVSLARALVTDPDVLLLDEPFGALDEFTRNRLDGELRSLWLDNGLTVVFVTHSIYEAVFLSTRVVVMAARPGRIVASVDIDGPSERTEDWRVAPEFVRHCAELSGALRAAHGPATPAGT